MPELQTTYVCPQSITDLFKTNPELGRMKAIEWAMGLVLNVGDKVWLPKIGWTEKIEEMTKQ